MSTSCGHLMEEGLIHVIQQVAPERPLLSVTSAGSTNLLQRDGLDPLHDVDVKHIHSVLAVH